MSSLLGCCNVIHLFFRTVNDQLLKPSMTSSVPPWSKGVCILPNYSSMCCDLRECKELVWNNFCSYILTWSLTYIFFLKFCLTTSHTRHQQIKCDELSWKTSPLVLGAVQLQIRKMEEEEKGREYEEQEVKGPSEPKYKNSMMMTIKRKCVKGLWIISSQHPNNA